VSDGALPFAAALGAAQPFSLFGPRAEAGNRTDAFPTGRENRRISFLFCPLPVNLSPNCRLMVAKLRENYGTKCVRAESPTSPADSALRSGKDCRSGAERPRQWPPI
jgi:hypothetical protein